MILNLQISLILDYINITISDESIGLFELIKKLTVARQRGYRFNQIN